MSTRSGRIRASVIDVSPSRTRKGVSPIRSPARTRRSSPPPQKTPPPATRSPGRKSPSRKSPSRKTTSKFPARKSPSRTTKEKEQTEPEKPVPKSPSKRAPIIEKRAPVIESDVAVKIKPLSVNLTSYQSTRSRLFEYSIKDLTANLKESEFSLDHMNGVDDNEVYGLRTRRLLEEVAPRRSSRLREYIDNVPDIRRSISKSVSNSKSVSKSLEAYSDEENSEEEFQTQRSKLATRKLATPLRSSISSITEIASKWEFGGRTGSACLILLIPLTVFYILISCNKSCSLISLSDLSKYKSLQSFVSLQAFGFVFLQYVIQAIFVMVPILGTKTDRMDGYGRKQCFNAISACICTLAVLLIMDYLQIIKKDNLLNGYLKLATISYLFAFILSIIVYTNSLNLDTHELNQYGNTGYMLYDFFIGREVHPFIKSLDIKLWIARTSNINALILLSLIIFKQGLEFKSDAKTDLILGTNNLTMAYIKLLMENVQLKPTTIIFSIMQIVYVLNFIMKEYKITTTFFWQCEAVGYLQTVSSALYPFYFTTITKHIADTALVLPTNTLIFASVLFILGFLIMFVSNSIKYQFRQNPLHPSLARLDSMVTFHGNKLLVCNLWGILRHPNYTGDILIHIVFALPGIMSRHYIAAAPPILTIFMLMHRSWRDHTRCQRRYGSAWQRYCKRVPSVIIPKLL